MVLNTSQQAHTIEVIMCASAELDCSVVTCSFSCLARFEQPSDGCVCDKTPQALSELYKLAGPELVHVSLF